MHTISVENYLKCIYHLQQKGEIVFTTSLAKKLRVAPASVTEMLQRLSNRGLIVYQKYNGVKLQQKGKLEALKIIRKHRLWEMFLVKHLGFKWDEIHDEAEKYEHIMSDKMEEKIDMLLNFPSVDPHGDPIPNKKGFIIIQKVKNLSEVQSAKKVKIIRVDDSSPKILQWANKNKISLGDNIQIAKNNKSKRSIDFQLNNKNISLNYSLAKNIFVKEVL